MHVLQLNFFLIFRIHHDTFLKIREEIIELFPILKSTASVIYHTGVEGNADSCGTTGELYSRYKTIRDKLRGARVLGKRGDSTKSKTPIGIKLKT